MSVSLLNTGNNPQQFLGSQVLSEKQTSTWCDKLEGALALAFVIGAITCEIFQVPHLTTSTVPRTFLALTAGGALQHALQKGLPKEWAFKEKDFLADYATPIFLVCSQIYLNLPPSHWSKEGVFFGLTALGGGAVASLAHTLFTTKIDEQVRGVSLQETRGNSEEEKTDDEQSVERPLLGENKSEKIRLLTLNTTLSRIAWNVLKGALALSAVGIGSTIEKGEIIRDFGIIIAGDAAAQLTSEWLINKMGDYRYYEGTGLNENAPEVKSLKLYKTVSKVFLALAQTLPGFLIVASGATQHKNLLPLHILSLLFVGVFDGGKRHIERARFTEIPHELLPELQYKPEPSTKIQKAFSLGKWTFAILGVGGFLALSLAGLNPQNGHFDHVKPFDIAALTAFTVSLYGSYALAQYAKERFKQDKKSKLANTAYFFSHYSQGIPLIALYIMEKMRIGDRSLAHDSLLTGILSTVAYFSLGTGIGIESNSRGEYPQPRVPTSLTMALIFRFIAHELTG